MVEYFTDYRSFHKARECCQGRGGDLLTVKTSEMNDLAQGMQDTEKEWNHAWTGLTNDEGKWTWVDGSTLDGYLNWGTGHPHVEPTGKAMVLRWTSGTWASVAETEMRRFDVDNTKVAISAAARPRLEQFLEDLGRLGLRDSLEEGPMVSWRGSWRQEE